MQWRELRATASRASGATLRRRLGEWDGTALLRQVHLALIRMIRAGPKPIPWDVVFDSCLVRASAANRTTARARKPAQVSPVSSSSTST